MFCLFATCPFLACVKLGIRHTERQSSWLRHRTSLAACAIFSGRRAVWGRSASCYSWGHRRRRQLIFMLNIWTSFSPFFKSCTPLTCHGLQSSRVLLRVIYIACVSTIQLWSNCVCLWGNHVVVGCWNFDQEGWFFASFYVLRGRMKPWYCNTNVVLSLDNCIFTFKKWSVGVDRIYNKCVDLPESY